MLRIQCPTCRLITREHEETVRRSRQQVCPLCGSRWRVDVPGPVPKADGSRSRNRVKQKRSPSPSQVRPVPWLLLIAGGIVAILLLVGVAFTGYFVWRRPVANALSGEPPGPAAPIDSATPSPSGAHVNYDDFLRVKEGMTVHDALALLGDPTSETSSGFDTRTLHWRDNRTFQVDLVFVKGVVQSATWYDIVGGQMSLRSGATGGLRAGR